MTCKDPHFTNELYTAISRLFGQSRVVREAKLKVRCILIYFDPQLASFTNLTYLVLDNPTPERWRDWLLMVPDLRTFGAVLALQFSLLFSGKDLTNMVFVELAERKLHSLMA